MHFVLARCAAQRDHIFLVAIKINVLILKTECQPCAGRTGAHIRQVFGHTGNGTARRFMGVARFPKRHFHLAAHWIDAITKITAIAAILSLQSSFDIHQLRILGHRECLAPLPSTVGTIQKLRTAVGNKPRLRIAAVGAAAPVALAAVGLNAVRITGA